MIFNQWPHGECAGFAILGALAQMKNVDGTKIAKELIDEPNNSLTFQIASNWFVRKWYIKWIRKCSYSDLLSKRLPILTGASNVDWEKTKLPPYKLTFKDASYKWPVGSHYFFIKSPWVVQNSWGDKWWDKWLFYFDKAQMSKFKQTWVLLI